MGEEAPTQGIPDQGASASTCAGRSSGLLVPVRYYFNLTDGDTMIRDEDGIVASSIQAAVVSVMEAVEEPRA